MGEQPTARNCSIDPARLAVFGQSAGGGLSAATALLARDRGGPPICFQYLGIPELDDRLQTPSMQRFVDTPMWNRPNAELSWDFYLGDQYQRGADDVPYHAAPARAEDLSGLPPAYVSTMEFDPLRDEGVEYALKLMRRGWPPSCTAFPAPFTAPASSPPPRSVGASRRKCLPSCAAHCALTPEKTSANNPAIRRHHDHRRTATTSP